MKLLLVTLVSGVLIINQSTVAVYPGQGGAAAAASSTANLTANEWLSDSDEERDSYRGQSTEQLLKSLQERSTRFNEEIADIKRMIPLAGAFDDFGLQAGAAAGPDVRSADAKRLASRANREFKALSAIKIQITSLLNKNADLHSNPEIQEIITLLKQQFVSINRLGGIGNAKLQSAARRAIDELDKSLVSDRGLMRGW